MNNKGNIICDESNCNGSVLYLSASMINRVNCIGNNSCNNMNIYCGISNPADFQSTNNLTYLDFNGDINQCIFTLNHNSMKRINTIKCSDNVKICKLKQNGNNTETNFTCITNTNGCNVQSMGLLFLMSLFIPCQQIFVLCTI